MKPVSSPHISDQIELRERIGFGGMGEVYKGILRGVGGFEKIIAVKTLFLDEVAAKKTFLNEAYILSKISHPNIVQILQAGEMPNGAPYLVCPS